MQIFEIDKSSLPEDVTDFVAVECGDCEYEGEGEFSQRYFRTEPEVECDQTHDQAVKLLKPLGFTKYSVFAAEEVILKEATSICALFFVADGSLCRKIPRTVFPLIQ